MQPFELDLREIQGVTAAVEASIKCLSRDRLINPFKDGTCQRCKSCDNFVESIVVALNRGEVKEEDYPLENTERFKKFHKPGTYLVKHKQGIFIEEMKVFMVSDIIYKVCFVDRKVPFYMAVHHLDKFYNRIE